MSPLMRWKNWCPDLLTHTQGSFLRAAALSGVWPRPKRVERLAMARSSTVVDAAREEDGKEPDNSSGSVHDVHEASPMNKTQLRRMMFVEAMLPGCTTCARLALVPGTLDT